MHSGKFKRGQIQIQGRATPYKIQGKPIAKRGGGAEAPPAH